MRIPGLDPDNENQRNFHSFLARNQYKVVSKDIRKYGDGKVKANLDIELVVDLMKTARNLDVAIVVSGDGDFAPAIRAVQEMGVRVEVISFRGNTSSDLIEVADIFTDITQLARVEKGSSRSGRRVAGDDEDLSMTEVPDKQTEGTGAGRGRGGRGRGRGRPGEAEPVAARGRAATNGTHDVAAGPGLTALPGEKLSKVAPVTGPADVPSADGSTAPLDAEDDSGLDADGRRRRRRRGGRGRGRGRGRELEPGFEPAAGAVGPQALPDAADGEADEEEDEVEIASAPRAPAHDAVRVRLGLAARRAELEADLDPARGRRRGLRRAGDPGVPDRRAAPRPGRPWRWRRPAGSRRAARWPRRIQRRGRPRAVRPRRRWRHQPLSRRQRQGASRRGSARPTERAGPVRQDRPPRQDRFDRQDRGDRPAGPRSSEPWSEVPEELEAMLRAQLAQSPKASPPASRREATGSEAAPSSAPSEASAGAEPATKRRTTTRRKTAATAVAASDGAASPEATADAPKRRAPRRKADVRRQPPATPPGPAPRRSGGRPGPRRRPSVLRRQPAIRPRATRPPVRMPPRPAPRPKRRTTRKKAETA